MGGFGSGQKRWWLEVPKVALPVLDCRELRRDGLLAVGSRWNVDCSGWALSFERTGASINCSAEPPSVLVAPTRFRVELTATKPHYGGLRHWMICPRCRGRVATLFIDEPPLIACRRCVGHVYESQLVPERLRGVRRAARIRELLGGEPGFAQPFPGRPAGMARARYDRLRREALTAEAAFVSAERERSLARYARARDAGGAPTRAMG
jgi:hypothetical protein